MAAKKRKGSAQPKRPGRVSKISAQTRVKLKQAAGKRKRAPKGSAYGGRFVAGPSKGPKKSGKARMSNKNQVRLARFNIDQQADARIVAEAADAYAGLKQGARAESAGLKAQRRVQKGGPSRVSHAGLPTRPTGSKKRKLQTQTGAQSLGQIATHPSYTMDDMPSAMKTIGHSTYGDAYNSFLAKGMSPEDADRAAFKMAAYQTHAITGAMPTAQDIGRQSMNVRWVETREADMGYKEGAWQKARGVYATEGAQRSQFKTPSRFIKEEMAPSHKAWIDEALANPKSEFNQGLTGATQTKGITGSPGAQHRLRVYTMALQEGRSHQEALEMLRQERRGRKSAPGQKYGVRQDVVDQSINRRSERRGRTDRYARAAPRPQEFKYGVEIPAVDNIDALRRKFPGLAETDYDKIQQAQRESIFDQVKKNNMWAIENQRAQFLQEKGLGESPDRVVFFTTNVGYPAVSAPADSALGQYVIRRRKKVARQSGLATNRQLDGMFPAAVRDMHIIEAGRGISGGMEGTYGLFSKGGWRVGTKRSKNFGKPVPFGSQLLYDSQGRPMYDEHGNVRYTEGFTRPISGGLMRDLGARVFIG